MSHPRSAVLLGFALSALCLVPCRAQQVDSDHDGLNDALEQRLLDQFVPEFRVGKDDCAGVPASFHPELTIPTPAAEDGTIYGQVFPVRGHVGPHPEVEVHFYHLWTRDCGGHGHPLDTEHVAVLLQASGPEFATSIWTARYWYAAAHENTVCDVSQIARASTLHAETKGATVWISPGKHASYLNERLCAGGCGADRCEHMERLRPAAVVNLGELAYPMNGVRFLKAAQWPLAAKMEATNFTPAAVARVDALPVSDIALYHAGRHPAQGIIARSASTEGAIAAGGGQTTEALGTAGDRTTGALDTAGDRTGGALATSTDKTTDALGRSYRDTTHALGKSARGVGKALRMGHKPKSNDADAAKP